MPAWRQKGTMAIYLGLFSYIIIANFDKAVINLTKHQKVDENASAPQENVYIKVGLPSYHSGAKATNSDSTINAVRYNHTPDRLDR